MRDIGENTKAFAAPFGCHYKDVESFLTTSTKLLTCMKTHKKDVATSPFRAALYYTKYYARSLWEGKFDCFDFPNVDALNCSKPLSAEVKGFTGDACSDHSQCAGGFCDAVKHTCDSGLCKAKCRDCGSGTDHNCGTRCVMAGKLSFTECTNARNPILNKELLPSSHLECQP